MGSKCVRTFEQCFVFYFVDVPIKFMQHVPCSHSHSVIGYCGSGVSACATRDECGKEVVGDWCPVLIWDFVYITVYVEYEEACAIDLFGGVCP